MKNDGKQSNPNCLTAHYLKIQFALHIRSTFENQIVNVLSKPA